jgi:tagatose-6-phosphate ketose/aldose isomerase
MGGDSTLSDPLRALLDLPEQEKNERGLEHTPREIWQQPDTWTKTYERCQDHAAELNDVLRRAGIGRGSTSSPTVYLVGAGTSDYTGRALAPLLRQRWGCDVWPLPSTTLLTEFEEYHLPGREYLWISFSRSGESPEGVALLEQALDRHREIRHLVITCNQQGPMAQLCLRHPDRALALVLDDAVNDRGLAMTSSFSNMVLAGQCVGHLEDFTHFGEIVAQMSETGRRFLPAAAEAAESMTSLGCTRGCFVGAGALRAVSDESALKVVELSAGKVTTMAETPLGLRHGPLSSVDGQSFFVAFLSSDARRRGYELDLLREIDRKHLGRVRAVVTARGDGDASSLVDHCLSLNCAGEFPDRYRPVLDVMLGQLIGLFGSMRSGLKPDQPSPGGTITRVVAPIKLYS